jgi:hypothetical protein
MQRGRCAQKLLVSPQEIALMFFLRHVAVCVASLFVVEWCCCCCCCFIIIRSFDVGAIPSWESQSVVDLRSGPCVRNIGGLTRNYAHACRDRNDSIAPPNINGVKSDTCPCKVKVCCDRKGRDVILDHGSDNVTKFVVSPPPPPARARASRGCCYHHDALVDTHPFEQVVLLSFLLTSRLLKRARCLSSQ